MMTEETPTKVVNLTITETVTYTMQVNIDEDDEMDETWAEHVWVQNGDPIKHFAYCSDREFEWEVEGE